MISHLLLQKDRKVAVVQRVKSVLEESRTRYEGKRKYGKPGERRRGEAFRSQFLEIFPVNPSEMHLQ
jgi:hypothetical protein